MEHTDEKEPLEAGEDGTFDLGDPSPPPSPVKRTQHTPSADDSKAPAAESELCGQPPSADESKNVELEAASEAGLSSSSPPPCDGASQGAEPSSPPPEESLEDGFEDAIEAMSLQDDKAAQTGLEGEKDDESSGVKKTVDVIRVSQEAAAAEQPRALGGRAESRIAAGLANVRLPMGYDKQLKAEEGATEGPVDSDDEEQFHDAFDSGPEMIKDAAKAREMKEMGNNHYRNKEFEDAVDYYTMALHYCPEDEDNKKDRAVYLANRAQGHLQLKEYDTVVEDCTSALELDPRYVKALLRRAQANERLEKYDMALQDTKTVLEIDPSLRMAKENVPRLEKLHNDKNERMKEEALGKLKELGNSILGNFGLSTDNFKMKQDPNTGSYSINFER